MEQIGGLFEGFYRGLEGGYQVFIRFFQGFDTDFYMKNAGDHMKETFNTQQGNGIFHNQTGDLTHTYLRVDIVKTCNGFSGHG